MVTPLGKPEVGAVTLLVVSTTVGGVIAQLYVLSSVIEVRELIAWKVVVKEFSEERDGLLPKVSVGCTYANSFAL